MPYKNIVFVKLEKRLFEDYRWYMMSERSQLNYIKLILLAAHNWNKIPKSVAALKKAFKTDQTVEELEESINEIKNNFPKFKSNKDFYYFSGFHEKTNYVKKGYPREIPGKSQGNPKEVVDKEKKRIDKEEDKEALKCLHLNNPEFKELWKSWREVRSRIKAPNTTKALALALNKLKKQPLETAVKMLEKAIECGWRSVYEPKPQNNDKSIIRYE